MCKRLWVSILVVLDIFRYQINATFLISNRNIINPCYAEYCPGALKRLKRQKTKAVTHKHSINPKTISKYELHEAPWQRKLGYKRNLSGHQEMHHFTSFINKRPLQLTKEKTGMPDWFFLTLV